MSTELDRHVLTLTARGRLRAPADGVTPRQAVRAILEGFTASGSQRMTIYFHGGLVNETNALVLAHHFHQEITENFDSYPVFVVWKSGPLETLQSAMLDINNSSPLFMQVLKKLMKWAARFLNRGAAPAFAEAVPWPGDLDDLLRALEADEPIADIDALAALDALAATGVGPISDQDVEALQQALADDADADRALGAIMAAARLRPSAAAAPEMAAGLPTANSATGFLSAAIVDRLSATPTAPAGAEAAPLAEGFFGLTLPEHWFFAGDILRAVQTRFDNGTDHGFLATILEEMYRVMYADKVGRFLWDEMKANAAGAYEPIAPGAADDDTPGGTLFLEELKEVLNNHPVDLNLIGHSAGSIHIAHFIAAGVAMMPEQFSLTNVIFTAPACNYALFKAKIAPNNAHIGRFRIYTMCDVYERRDPLVKLMPMLYPHSLLYLVSGLFEDVSDTPLIGLERHLEGVTDAEVRAFLDIFANASLAPVVYAVTPSGTPVGERAAFISHYGLVGPNYDRATLDSIAIQIRPAPVGDLAPLMATSPEQADLLEPVAAVILAAEGVADQMVDDEPLVMPLQEAAAIGHAEQAPALLEQIIGTNDIVDHALIDVLVRTGRAVARIVAMGVKEMDRIEPEKRRETWAETARAGRLIQGYGTGWVLGNARRVLITNNHVLPLPEAAQSAQIEFGYERILRRGTVAQLVLRLRPDELFLTDVNMAFGGLDYTVVALSRPAPEDFGFLEPVQGITASTARNVFVVQHPGGGGKAYVLNHNHKVNLTDRYVTYVSDTLEGSSGSPLFNDEGDLIGIHHLGAYMTRIGTREEITNLGSRIEFVIEDIAARLRAQGEWDEQKIAYWFGDGAVLRAWRRQGQA